jgi:hypothetical protein
MIALRCGRMPGAGAGFDEDSDSTELAEVLSAVAQSLCCHPHCRPRDLSRRRLGEGGSEARSTTTNWRRRTNEARRG